MAHAQQISDYIVLRTAYITAQVRRAAAILLQRPVDHATLNEDSVTHHQLEAYVKHWRFLMPDDPAEKAVVFRILTERFPLSQATTPTTLVALGVNNTDVQAAYEAQYDATMTEQLTEVVDMPDPDTLQNTVIAGLEWQFLRRGKTLLQQDATGLGMHVVLDGVLMVEHDGTEVVEVGAGSFLGEMSLLTGEPNSATVKALRDSSLVFLSNERFETLSVAYPELMRAIAVQTIERLRTQTQQARSQPQNQLRIFAIIPASAGLDDFFYDLRENLASHGRVLLLTPETIYEYIDLPNGALEAFAESYECLAWFERARRDNDYLICVADADYPKWTRRIVDQATRLLTIGRGDDKPTLSAAERLLGQLPHPELIPQQDLVLLHQRRDQLPRNTADWLKARTVNRHHHIAVGHAADLARLSRHLRDKALGVVFGGGGMRGVAHAGVLKAMDELGIEADLAGGTSAGSIVAAQFGLEWSHQRILQETEAKLMQRSTVFQITFPYAALTTGKRLSQVYDEMFGGVEIEDLWKPIFTIASNLTQARINIMDSGSLKLAVRASTSLAGIFPPTIDTNNDLLIDGGGFNNTPADVMRQKVGVGTVIAVDMGFTKRERPTYNYGSHLNGFRWLFNRLNPLRQERLIAPFIVGTMMRSNALWSIQKTNEQIAHADFVLRPPVSAYGLYDFDSADAIYQAGYDDALVQLQTWLDEGSLAQN